MKSAASVPLLSALRLASAATIYLAGDSTMADHPNDNIQGWGEYLQYSFDSADYVVDNRAVSGRSARSYTREGRFQDIADVVQSGDWVVIEFGHNDGGSLDPDNGRSDCFGDGDQTCETNYDGQDETVLTYPAYYQNAAELFLPLGANVVMSPATPNNIWEDGSGNWGPSRFDYYAWLAASREGGPANGVWYVPHGDYAAQAMMHLGADTVNANYPNDHTHTAPYLADVMAKSFVLGLKCGTSPLGDAAVNSTDSMTTTILGPCISFNSSVPI